MGKRTVSGLVRIAWLITVAAVGVETAAEDEPALSLGLSAGAPTSYSSEEGFEPVLGMKGTWRLSERWATEAGLSWRESRVYFGGPAVDPAVGSGDRDSWTLDLAARYLLSRGERSDFYLRWGVGWTELDVERSDPFLGEDSTLSGFFGVGWEIDLGERFFVCPELGHRQVDDESVFESGVEAAVGFGFRF